jgi:hypothetical protein
MTAVTHPTTALGAGPFPGLPGGVQPVMLPAGTGTEVATPCVTLKVVAEGITFNVTASVAGPPGRALPPAAPAPPTEFHTVLTRMENVSVPINVAEGGV